MFLADLSVTNKRTLLALIETMIAADGVFAPEEQEMLDDVIAEMGLNEESRSAPATVEELCAAVSEPRARALMLLELASIAIVDHDYAGEERDLLHSIAAYWTIDPITLIRVEGWAEKRIDLSREAAEVTHEIVLSGRRS